MDKYTARATEVQEGVLDKDIDSNVTVDDATLRRAVYHTRLDVVLLASYLRDANLQLRTIRRLMRALVVAALVLLDRWA